MSNIECSMSNVQGAIHRLDIEHRAFDIENCQR